MKRDAVHRVHVFLCTQTRMPCDAMRLRRCHAVAEPAPAPCRLFPGGASPAPLPGGVCPRHPSPVTRHPSRSRLPRNLCLATFPASSHPGIPRPRPPRHAGTLARWHGKGGGFPPPSASHCWRSGQSPQAIAAAFRLLAPCARNPTITDLERTAQSPQEAQVTPG
jgi:hypothetical protein